MKQEGQTQAFSPQKTAGTTLQQVLDKVRVAAFKNGVRTIEFFKDFDKLRSGVITENQFERALTLAGREAKLSATDIKQIVDFYRSPDGGVLYKDFCETVDNAFNVPDLEKKPTMDVMLPPHGALGRNLPILSDIEENRVRSIINLLSEQVQQRRLMMYQYFKDYDRGKGYSRIITPTQFGRILHFLSLNVAPEDFKLLCHKFADLQTGDINYPAFVQAVDRDFTNYTQDTGSSEHYSHGDMQTILSDSEPIDRAMPLRLDKIMDRIRHHVLTNRRRVCEFFQDFDPLRSGSITKSQFRRGLSDLGLSALGQLNLSEREFEHLRSYYENPIMTDKVLWTRFMDDVEFIFTQKDLEKFPSHQVPPQDIFLVSKPGTVNWDYAAEEHRDLVDETMDRLRQR